MSWLLPVVVDVDAAEVVSRQPTAGAATAHCLVITGGDDDVSDDVTTEAAVHTHAGNHDDVKK